MPTKRKYIKKHKCQKGGYKYNSSQILDSLSEEIKSSSSSNSRTKTAQNKNKTKKRYRHKSRK
jgi:hypothetical protein